MATPFDSPKQQLRNHMRAALSSLSPAHRSSISAKARFLLAAQPAWQFAQSILFFAPMPTELDLWPLMTAAIAAGKTIALPRFVPETSSYVACQISSSTHLTTGRFGIREPTDGCPQIPLNKLDFILVPGLAFDLQGRRLGRGKGFYDRMLAAVRGKTCGVAFDEQIVRDVPVEPLDISVDCILTPTRWIEL